VKLSGFGLYRYDLPLTEPLVLKGATLHRREGLLLRLAGEDGSEGWGEAAPLPGFSRETLDEAAGQLLGLSEKMVGREPAGLVAGRDLCVPDISPSARFAVELAVRDLETVKTGVSAPNLAQPEAGDVLWVSGLLSGPSGKVIEEAARMREAGYRAVKLKVGGRPVEEDARLVHKLRGILGESAALRLDANRAWSFEEASEFARAVRDTGIEYVEEPLADPGRLRDLAANHGLPVALDESLLDMDPEDLEFHPYIQAVVLKPTFLGGLSRAEGFADRAASLGMTPVVSSAYESGIGTAALAALAFRTGGGEMPAGLDTYRRLAADVLDPRPDLTAPALTFGEAALPRAPRLDRLAFVGGTAP